MSISRGNLHIASFAGRAFAIPVRPVLVTHSFAVSPQIRTLSAHVSFPWRVRHCPPELGHVTEYRGIYFVSSVPEQIFLIS